MHDSVSRLYDIAIDSSRIDDFFSTITSLTKSKEAAIFIPGMTFDPAPVCGCENGGKSFFLLEKATLLDLRNIFGKPRATRVSKKHNEILVRENHASQSHDIIGATFTVNEHTGFIAVAGRFRCEKEACDTLDRLIPHLERSIAQYLKRKKLEAENLANEYGLDRMDVGVFLLAKGGRIARSNRAGRVMVSRGILEIDGDILTCPGREAARCLEQAFKTADGRAFAVPRAAEYPLLMEVHPLSCERMAQTVRIVFVRDPSAPPLPSVETLCTLYEFSRTEARLALSFACGHSIQDFAQEWNFSEAYVKTLSKRTLARVSAGTRVNLVRMVLGSAF